MTLVGDPRIIFLDEPTTGLDPRSRRVMWDIVRDLVADGVTIFLTTQYLEEADRLADRGSRCSTAGRVVAEGTPAELKRLVPGRQRPPRVRRRRRSSSGPQRALGGGVARRGGARARGRRATAASTRCAPLLDRLDDGLDRGRWAVRRARPTSTTCSCP